VGPFHNTYKFNILTIPVNEHVHTHLFISSNTKNVLLVYYKQYKNVFCRSLDSITTHTLVMLTEKNNCAEVSYKNRFCSDRACIQKKACTVISIKMTTTQIFLFLATIFYFIVNENLTILTFSCLNLVRILISLNVRWQYVWCSNGDIFLIATLVFVTLS
jgi:hypothetical protein